MLASRKVLITGASGFVGNNLVRILELHNLFLAVRNPDALNNIPHSSKVVSLEEISRELFPVWMW